jgi:glycosyltransferase involved in cell wall biosynthesis
MRIHKKLRDTIAAYWRLASIHLNLGGQLTCSRDARVLQSEPRRLLMVLDSFAPELNAGVFRPLAFARYGATLGWSVTVLARSAGEGAHPGGSELLKSLPSAVQIKHWSEQLTPIIRAFPAIDGGFPAVFGMLSRAAAVFPESRPSVVMASGPPFSTFVAASAIARRLAIPLVLDYRDEWSECPFDFVVAGKTDRGWERRCLRRAAKVLVTTQSQRSHLLKTFKEITPGRCVVLPNGWEPNDFCGPSSEDDKIGDAEDIRTISFVGNLAEHTLPGTFLDALAALLRKRPEMKNRLRLQLVGRVSRQAQIQIDRFPEPSIVRQLGALGKQAAVDIMRRSTALLLINEPRLARYLPGKLYDYLAARRPLLVVGDSGEVAAVVRRLRAGPIVADGDLPALERSVDEVFDTMRWEDGIAQRHTWLQRHTRAELAHQMFAILDNLVCD